MVQPHYDNLMASLIAIGAEAADRRMVNITPSDPGDVKSYGAAHLGRCAS